MLWLSSDTLLIRMGRQREWIVFLFVIVFLLLVYYFREEHSTKWHSLLKSVKYEANPRITEITIPLSKILEGKVIELAQDDQRILSYIWDNRLIEPSSSEAEYNLDRPNIDPSCGQGQFIRGILGNMTKGFFVECGAFNGETQSNTLFLEQHLGWKGLLVEGDPINYKAIKTKGRKAWTSNTCLAVKPYPHLANFLQRRDIGKIVMSPSQKQSEVTAVQCMPLFTLLTALDVTTVDYFSLDVEGSELQILKTIPWDKLSIKTLSVEFIHTVEGKGELVKFMKSKNYKVFDKIPGGFKKDLIFVHDTVKIVDSVGKIYPNRKSKGCFS